MAMLNNQMVYHYINSHHHSSPFITPLIPPGGDPLPGAAPLGREWPGGVLLFATWRSSEAQEDVIFHSMAI